MEPGPALDAVLGDALEVLRIVAVLASSRDPDDAAEEIWRRIGLAGTPGDQRLPDAAAWGGYPGGVPSRRATRSSPASRCLDVRWTDNHCHLVDERPARRAAAVATRPRPGSIA